MTDEKLFELCQLYGERARMWKQKFLGLLPEVYERRLYRKKGFSSIFEFGAKLGGVSEEQVKTVLRLDEKFKDKPELHNLLTGGIVSIHKLSRVASIASQTSSHFWADKVQVLPQASVEALVKDERIRQSCGKLLRAQNLSTAILQLSPEAIAKLQELQEKGIDVSSLILDLLKEREEKIQTKKHALLAEVTTSKNTSRYIPQRIKKLLIEEYGTKCAISSCKNKAQLIHHTQRFSIDKTHNPLYLAPLCQAHHRIAHVVDTKYAVH